MINEDHGVFLVQHVESGKFYVKKTLEVFNINVIQRLKQYPVTGMPKVIEVIEDNGKAILIEEYIHGDNLETVISSGASIPEKTAVDYACQLCDIVGRLHSLKPPIVHRDIKPSNIIITADDKVRLLDLNATRFATDDAREDTIIMGTTGYAAPEQFGFTASTATADIYAIGVVINRLLTKTFPKYSLPENKKIRAVVERCTKMDPAARYLNTDEIKTDLVKIRKEYFKQKTNNWADYLPPGFRSKNILVYAIATILYTLVIGVCLTMQVTNTTPTQLWIERIFCFLIIMVNTLFAGNYLGIQKYCPLTRSKKRIPRFLGILATCVILTITLLVVMVIVES